MDKRYIMWGLIGAFGTATLWSYNNMATSYKVKQLDKQIPSLIQAYEKGWEKRHDCLEEVRAAFECENLSNECYNDDDKTQKEIETCAKTLTSRIKECEEEAKRKESECILASYLDTEKLLKEILTKQYY